MVYPRVNFTFTFTFVVVVENVTQAKAVATWLSVAFVGVVCFFLRRFARVGYAFA